MQGAMSRRSVLEYLALGTGAMVAGIAGPRHAAASRNPEAASPEVGCAGAARRPWYQLGIMGDPVTDNQLLYLLGGAWDGTTDVGECLETASRIDRADAWSWHREWVRTADRLRAAGDASASAGHRVSAGEAYLRSSAYYRGALLHHPEPRHTSVLETATQGRACFERAASLLSIPVRAVRIPYENTTLPGYYYRRAPRGRAPVLIIFQGRDAWPEDSRYLAEGAVRRGYHCLQFHGPGQGLAIRAQGLTFRSDWERVITPVVDFIVRQPGIDPDRVVLIGMSMGGALAPRAVAFEKRIHTCVANPGVYSWGDAIFAYLEALAPGLTGLAVTDPASCDARARQLMGVAPLFNWWFKDSMWKHGADSPSQLLRELRKFSNAAIVERIACRMLIMDGEAEAFTRGEAKRLYDALRCPRHYMLFSEEDAGLVHCQAGARAVASQRMFDWLDENVRA